ncbi:MAG TPA: GNAT family protein [Gemmataceae bacterium]|nr:GNAT family protein [Gemmataceae bacterium]
MSNAPIFFRPLEMGDVDRIHAWHNDVSLFESLIGTHRPVGRAGIEEWLRKRQLYSHDEINLALCVSSDGKHIGNLYLRDINWIARHGELHILIGDSTHRGCGYGQQAVRHFIDHAFQQLGLRRLHLQVLATNLAAIHVYEKCGFVIEGRLRQHAFKNGVFVDVLVMGLCRDGHESTLDASQSPG